MISFLTSLGDMLARAILFCVSPTLSEEYKHVAAELESPEGWEKDYLGRLCKDELILTISRLENYRVTMDSPVRYQFSFREECLILAAMERMIDKQHKEKFTLYLERKRREKAKDSPKP